MEGLTITPDGRTLVGIMQNALLQDHGVDPTTIGRVGFNNRILTVDLLTGRTHQYVYVMDAVNQGRGVNEMLAINSHEFLVLERDNRTLVPTPPNSAQTPNLKRIYKIDLAKPGLTDVSDIDELPQGALDPSIVPVTKTLFVDLLDPSYKINATQTIKDVIPEKIESMAWGPDLKDGRHVLVRAQRQRSVSWTGYADLCVRRRRGGRERQIPSSDRSAARAEPARAAVRSLQVSNWRAWFCQHRCECRRRPGANRWHLVSVDAANNQQIQPSSGQPSPHERAERSPALETR